MRFVQEAFSVEEGNRLYRKLSGILVEKYGAKPIDDLSKAGWDSDIRIPVSETSRSFDVEIKRKRVGAWFDATIFESAKIKIGRKRWTKLTWEDGEWEFNREKLFDKIGDEMLQLKGEYLTANAEEKEMAANRRKIAAELGIEKNSITMRTPFVAMISLDFGNILLGYRPEKTLNYRYRLIELDISGRENWLLGKVRVIQLISVLNSLL